jgi:transposase
MKLAELAQARGQLVAFADEMLGSLPQSDQPKALLRGHAMFHGDVPAALQTLGSVEEVENYCTRLIDEVGYEGGFVLGTGCDTAPECKFENLRALVLCSPSKMIDWAHQTASRRCAVPKGERYRVEVPPEDEVTLRMWAASRKGKRRLCERARVILLSAEGKPLSAISAATGLSPQAASKWRRRYLEASLDGLRDRPRAGRPLSIEAQVRLNVVALASSEPPDGYSRWSTRRLAEKAGIGPTSVHRILHEGSLKPHKTEYWCGRSPDPEFEAKQAAILGLYLDPPINALVVCVDEKSQIQALDRTQPELPVQAGSPRRLTATYKRHGTTCLLAALAVHSGEVSGRCVEANDHESFLRFLKALYRSHPRRELHVILDNLSVHKHQDVLAWAAHRRRLTLHFTPTYASWLNQVEIWFGIFARDVLKDAVWHSKAELVSHIMEYIRSYSSQRAKPFRWTYTGKPLAA